MGVTAKGPPGSVLGSATSFGSAWRAPAATAAGLARHLIGAALRAQRIDASLTLAIVADALGTWPTRVSELERGLIHGAELAHRYQLWLRPDRQAA